MASCGQSSTTLEAQADSVQSSVAQKTTADWSIERVSPGFDEWLAADLSQVKCPERPAEAARIPTEAETKYLPPQMKFGWLPKGFEATSVQSDDLHAFSIIWFF